MVSKNTLWQKLTGKKTKNDEQDTKVLITEINILINTVFKMFATHGKIHYGPSKANIRLQVSCSRT